MFDPVVSSLYRMPKVFGIVQEASESWDREHLLAIDSQFIPENNSDIQGVPDSSAKEITAPP